MPKAETKKRAKAMHKFGGALNLPSKFWTRFTYSRCDADALHANLPMPRLKRFAHSLASGYVLLGAHTAYTLVSIPLAFRFLSEAEFGLWALTTQLAGYLALLDFGMSGAIMRILIDFKDDRTERNYGSVILTGFLVNVLQGGLILGFSLAASFALGPLLLIPLELRDEFQGLVIWQGVLLSANLLIRPATMILSAHQRYDWVNYPQAAGFGVNFGVLWMGFALGQSVWAMIWAQAAAQIVATAFNVWGCCRLKLLPSREEWGRPNWSRFRDLFSFGRDMFLYMLGNQLINASQTILITRLIGLEAGAVWSVCTRVFILMTQLIMRLFDYSCAALSEMLVRQEKQRLFARFRSIVLTSGSVSVVAGLGLAIGNQPFVEWWTGGKLSWPAVNDWLLAVWLPILVMVRCHTGLAGLTKEFRFMRYLYFVEGLVFVSVAWIGLRYGGMTTMLMLSILCSLVFSYPYSILRTANMFGLEWITVAAQWMGPSFRLAILLAPAALVAAWTTKSLPPTARLAICAGVVGCLGAYLLPRWGLDQGLRRELIERIPQRLRWLRPCLGALETPSFPPR